MKQNSYSWWMDRLRRVFALRPRAPGSLPGSSTAISAFPRVRLAPTVAGWRAGKDLFQTAYDELGPLNFIAEDLGYLTPGVRAMASTCGFPGMDVLEFSDYDVRCGVHPRPARSYTPRRTIRRRWPVGAHVPLRAAMNRAVLSWRPS